MSSFDPALQSGFQLAFSQPLLKDRKIDLARQQTIIAKRNLESSELRVRESVVQTAAAVKQAYWTLKATLANVTVQQRSLELAQELARQNKARVDVGQTPPLDLLQAEAEVAQRRENLIRANTAAGDAEDRLRRLIMDPADASFWRVRLEPTDEPALGGVLPDVDAVAAGAFDERYDLARARKDLENIVTNVEFFNNQKLPDVRLETSYRGSGLGGTRFLRTGEFPGTVIGTARRSYGSALGQMFDSDVSDVERRADRELFAWAQLRGGGSGAGRRSSAGRRRSASRACSCRSPRRSGRPCGRCTAPPSVSKRRARGRPSRASASTSSSGGTRWGCRRPSSSRRHSAICCRPK